MTTSITADQYLANLTRRGVEWKFYKDKADFLRHNRNAAPANARVTPGGFGPVYGVGIHNTAMTASEARQLEYLYTGDGPNSSKPGPLCTGAITKAGVLVLMGWGACTHMGPGDPRAIAKLKANALSLTGEYQPTTDGTMPGTVAVNPFVLGYENTGTSLNAAQVKASALIAAASLEVMGPTSEYGGGSVIMHREVTTNRSDPVGVPKDGSLRRAVQALRKGWDNAVVSPEPVQLRATEAVVTLDRSRITSNQLVKLTSTARDAKTLDPVAGIHIFEWARPGAPTWTEFKRVSSTTGKAGAESTPGDNVIYRVRFAPTDKAHAIDWSPNVAVDVYTLAEYDALASRVQQLAARVAELEGK